MGTCQCTDVHDKCTCEKCEQKEEKTETKLTVQDVVLGICPDAF